VIQAGAELGDKGLPPARRRERHPGGMLHACAYGSDDEQKIITCRAGFPRGTAFFRGRELIVPEQP
jgi:hypothetical protein